VHTQASSGTHYTTQVYQLLLCDCSHPLCPLAASHFLLYACYWPAPSKPYVCKDNQSVRYLLLCSFDTHSLLLCHPLRGPTERPTGISPGAARGARRTDMVANSHCDMPPNMLETYFPLANFVLKGSNLVLQEVYMSACLHQNRCQAFALLLTWRIPLI
jgi:hypothetical protein